MDSQTITPRFTAVTNHAALTRALKITGLITTTHPPTPALRGVLIEGSPRELTLTTYDYDTRITVRVDDATATVGRILIDHAEAIKLLAALVKGDTKKTAQAKDVLLYTDTNGHPAMEIDQQRVPLESLPVTDFPDLPAVAPSVALIDRERWAAELIRLLPAVSNDTRLPMLSGLQVTYRSGMVELAATDRYRLSVARIPALLASGSTPGNRGPLIPAQIMAKLMPQLTGSTLDLGMHQDDDKESPLMSLVCDDVTVITRTLGPDFPNYRNLFPAQVRTTATIDRSALFTQAQRAEAIVKAKKDTGMPVAIDITAEGARVIARLSERTQTVSAPILPGRTVGADERCIVSLNPAFLVSALKSINSDTVTLHVAAPTEPVVFTEGPDELTAPSAYRHLLKPAHMP